MDSLTARLMSRSGLNPVDPTLPPVHNMRVVYLKEEFGHAEEALHEARVALDALEKAQRKHAANVPDLKEDLYDAMAKLAVKERDYFANRYFGRDKAVLKGWNVDRKQKLFKKKIDDMKKLTDARQKLLSGRVQFYHNGALRAARSAFAASLTLDTMNKKWYATGSGVRSTTTPAFFGSDLEVIQKAIQNIHNHLRTAMALPETDATRPTSLQSIRASLRDAEICQRLAHLVMKNRWDLPDDLREQPRTP